MVIVTATDIIRIMNLCNSEVDLLTASNAVIVLKETSYSVQHVGSVWFSLTVFLIWNSYFNGP